MIFNFDFWYEKRRLISAAAIFSLQFGYLQASGIDKCCKKDDDEPQAQITTSACVNGQVVASIAAGAGGYTPPSVTAPQNPGSRTVSGNAPNDFRYSQNDSVVKVVPGKEYSVNWQKVGTSVVGSLHTRITPKNLPEGFKVQINNGDGQGWRDQTHIDNAGGIADPSAMVHKFRVIGPVSDAGKISSVDLTSTRFGTRSNPNQNGLALIGIDDGNGFPDWELSRAKVSIELGTAIENGIPVSAGQLIFRSGLYVPALQTFSIAPALLSYEGPSNSSIQIITSANGNIRQIKTSDALADVVTVSGNKFEVKVYSIGNVGSQSGSGQPYAVSGQPISRCVFENSGSFSASPFSGSFPYGVKVTKFENEIQMSQVSVGGKFDLQKFQCVINRDGEIESVENLKTSVDVGDTIVIGPYNHNVTTQAQWYRDETREVRRDGARVSKSIKKYLFHSIGGQGTAGPLGGFGDVLISSKDFYGSGNSDYLLTEQWVNLHTTTTSTFGAFNAGAFGKPAFIVRSDGSWERYFYNINGQVSKTYRPYKGLPASPLDATDTNCIVETSDTKADPYSVPGPTLPPGFLEALEDLDGLTEQKINGVTVSKSETTYTKVTVNGQPATRATLRSYSGTSSYVDKITDTYHHTAPAVMRGKNAVVSEPAGERLESVYEIGDFNDTTRIFTPSSSGRDTREITTQGTSANPAGIANKTYRDLKVFREDGQLVQSSKQIYTGGTSYENATTTDCFHNNLGEQIRTEIDGRVVEEVEINGPLSITKDEAGIETTVLKDDLGRIVSQSKSGGPTTTYSRSGLTETKTRGSLTSVTVSDQLGRVASEQSETGALKSYDYKNGGRDTEITWPGGLKTRTNNYAGGLLLSQVNTNGSKTVQSYYTYTTETTGDQTTKEFIGTSNSTRWNQATNDWMGRKKSMVKPSPDGSGNVTVTTSYNAQGLAQTESYSSNTGLMPRRFEYDALGRMFREGVDIGNNSSLDTSSSDNITEYDRSFEKIAGYWYDVQETREYRTTNSSSYVVLDISKQRLHANGEGFAAKKINTDQNGKITTQLVSFDRANKKEINTTLASDLTGQYVQTAINGLLVSTSGPTSSESYQYDSLERIWKLINERTGAVTTFAYDPATGEKTSVTDHLGKLTSYSYYPSSHKSAGQLKFTTDPLLKKLYLEYNDAGQEIRRWGDTSYPVQKAYTSYAELQTLTTYRGGSGWSGASWPTGSEGTGDTTTWQYFGPTGLLQFKQDAAGRKVNYTWKANGKPATRINARSITTTYSYNGAGYATTTAYTDGTPGVTVVPGRNGQAGTVTDAAGIHTYTYADGGGIQTEAISGTGPLSGLSLGYHYAPNGEYDTLQVTSASSTLYQVSRAFYENNGLLKSVSSGLASAKYFYKPDSALISQVDSQWNGSTSVANYRTYDVLDRLLTTKHFTPSAVQPLSYASYELDDLGRRKKTTFQDGSFWDYGYSDRSEVIRADKKLNGSFLAGQQFRYTPDNIGNIVTKETGGDGSGSSRRTFTTPANNLNQHSGYATPASFDILGQALGSPAVTVNGSAAAYQGNYFRSEVTASNANVNGDWKSITVVSGAQSRTGNIYLAPASFTPTYDFDGNLTDDGEWVYAWDGENRLKSATRSSRAQTAGAPYRRVEFGYDSQNRCVQRSEFFSSAGPATAVERSLYDGWNRVATMDGSNSIQQKFTWGLDLTGSLTAAGGVGALLWIEDAMSGAFHFACSDGNGNVSSLIDGATKNVTASYEYGPLGESIRRNGSYADKNPYRFSSKAEDSLTALLYYGHRYYKAEWGVWLSNDPIEHNGGANLYLFSGNDGVNRWDLLGLIYTGNAYGPILPGLRTYGESGANSISDLAAWNIGKAVAQAAGHELTLAAMNHADGTIPGDWNLNARENELAKRATSMYATEESTGKDFYKWFKDELYNKFYRKSSGIYFWRSSKTGFHYPKPTDGYTAFGDARLKGSGTVEVCKNLLYTTIIAEDATFELSDNFSFSAYDDLGNGKNWTPTAVGYRLQDSGFIRSFRTSGNWKTTGNFEYFGNR